MRILLTDLFQSEDEVFPTLEEAFAAVMARYPQAVFSDVEWNEPTIWVWPSNAASQDADPARATGWIRQQPSPERGPGAHRKDDDDRS